MFRLERYDWSCNTVEDPFGRICVCNRMEDVNLKVFDMIKKTNESKTLMKDISCECTCKFVEKAVWGKKQSNSKCQCKCKTPVK